MKIATGTQMAAIDKKTIEELGMPGPVLMENAARAVCRAFTGHLEMLCSCEKCKRPAVLVLCGSGNNGGDGFCIARIIAGWGFPVKVVHIGRAESLKADAKLNHDLALAYGLTITRIENESDLTLLGEELNHADWLVDAVFGTGLSRTITGISAQALEMVAKSEKKSVAVDIPSGINSDTGEVLGPVIPASLTVTFGLPKWGHFLLPGARYAGKLVVGDIGFPGQLLASDEISTDITSQELVKSLIPVRSMDAHKTTYGRLAVVGGSRSTLGAAVMAGKAALRTGTGYVILYVPYSLEPFAKTIAMELVTRSLPEGDEGYFAGTADEQFFSLAGDSSAVALGPGIGTKPPVIEFVRNLLQKNTLPVVIDADALTILAKAEDISPEHQAPWVLTPHPAEAARLLQVETKDILADPPGCALQLAKKFGAVVALKSPFTIIASPEGRMRVNTTGNQVLAVMGTGDLLTGIIGSLLARGVDPFDAASAGVYIHGVMGEVASRTFSPEGTIPPDMLTVIPAAMETIRQGHVEEKVTILR